MIYIENGSTNPYYNLALEEYFLGGASEDILLLWQNKNTVVVGRYQNTEQETDERFCRANDISIVRRNTGGGAVYHDLGNLNFSIITGYKQGDDISFARFSGAILAALKKLGVDARFQGRNDLVVDGLKISGGAQAIQHGRILHHGTLLCCTDLDMLSGALRAGRELSERGHILPAQSPPEQSHSEQASQEQSPPEQSHLEQASQVQSPPEHSHTAHPCSDGSKSKAIASVRSRVANIQDFNNTVTVDLLKSSLLAEFGGTAPLERRELSAAEIADIRLLQKSKYETWQWNYGESPEISRKE